MLTVSNLPLSPFYVSRIYSDRPWSAYSHSHTHSEILVVTAGNLEVRYEDSLHHLYTGDVIKYPPRLLHHETVSEGLPIDFFCIGFHESRESSLLSAHDTSGRLRIISRWMYDETLSTYPRSGYLQASLLEAFRLELEKAQTVGRGRTAERIRSFMRNNLAKTISLDALAEEVRLSRTHLIRVYREETGHTPMQDLRQLRLETARDLIASTNLPLKGIAPLTGFQNEQHLAHAFRRYLKTTPGHFRDKHLREKKEKA